MGRVPGVRVVARLECPPKLNLLLEVLGRRPDGYHDIETVMVLLDGPCDRISMEEVSTPGVTIRVGGPFAGGVPGGPENLAVRAFRAVHDSRGREPSAHLRLRKRIPPGSGLGGGSSDAAGAMRLAGIPGSDTLDRVAAWLGSDVPFFLRREHACLARGRGEILEPVPAGNHRFLVLWPGVPCSTAEVYARCRPAAEGERRSPEAVLAALAGSDPVALRLACFNRLAGPAEEVCPAVRGARERLEALGQGPSFVTGSGSAAFVVLDRDADADTLRERLAPREGECAFVARCGPETGEK